jgi:hypothetical protein
MGGRAVWRTFALLSASFVVLAVCFEATLPSIATRLNVWFGTDIPLYSQWWMRGISTRSHWHPLAFALYDAFGRCIRAIGLDPAALPLAVVALPVIAVTSTAMSSTLAVLLRGEQRAPACVAAMLLVGPAVLLAPIPDTHMAGGAALLAEGALLLAWHRGDRRPATLLTAACAGLVAGGFSLTSFGPAAALLASCPRTPRRVLVPLVVLAACVIALLVALLWRHVTFEAAFAVAPSPSSLWQSARQLVLAQFGLPYVVAAPNADPIAPTDALSVAAPTGWSVLAAALWLGAICAERSRCPSRGGEARLAIASSLSLVGLVAFHSVYAATEAFMFAPHAWPFVVLPGLAILTDRDSSAASRIAVLAALLACAIQTVLAASTLLAAMAALRA